MSVRLHDRQNIKEKVGKKMVNLPSVTVYERIACIYINKTFRSLLHDYLL